MVGMNRKQFPQRLDRLLEIVRLKADEIGLELGRIEVKPDALAKYTQFQLGADRWQIARMDYCSNQLQAVKFSRKSYFYWHAFIQPHVNRVRAEQKLDK